MTTATLRKLLTATLCALFACAASAQTKGGEADPEGAKAAPPSKSTVTRKDVREQAKAAKMNPELECSGEADPTQARGTKPTPSTTTRPEVRAEAIKARRAGGIPCGEADPDKPVAAAKAKK